MRPPLKAPHCPFCGTELPRCTDGGIGQWSQFQGGTCGCGAIFGSDPRGNNLGALFMDVMVFACNGDIDRALCLTEGEDYEEAWLYGYDERLHHLVPNARGPRRGVGAILVVRLIHR